MDPLSRVEFRAGAGLVDDAKRSRTRQVTIVSRERWKAVAEALGQHVDPVLRRANLLISGVDLENSRGNMLRVGSGRLRVNGETRPCERMDEPLPGLRAERRHRWGGGVYASVLEDGKSAVGGPVEGERAAPRKPEQSLSRRSPPPRRRRAGSCGLRPRRLHRPLPRAHPPRGDSQRPALKSLGIRDYARHCETDVGQTPFFIGGRASSTRRRRIRSFDPGYSGTIRDPSR